MCEIAVDENMLVKFYILCSQFHYNIINTFMFLVGDPMVLVGEFGGS